MTVKELIMILSKFPDDMLVMGQKWNQCWSGDLNDTDLSDYEPSHIADVREAKIPVEWKKDHPKYESTNWKSRYDLQKCVYIRAND